MGEGFDVRLANPAAIQQYKGLKHSDDAHDNPRNDVFLDYLSDRGLRRQGSLMNERLNLGENRVHDVLGNFLGESGQRLLAHACR